MIDKNAVASKLLWLDLEMTGLNPESDVILEVAAEVTDFDFNILASYEAVIAQPKEKMDQMNEWCVTQHSSSGLLDRINKEGRVESEVIQEVAGFIKKHFGEESAVLAGNSIHNDRVFIKAWWPEVEALLHYRMVDVSSFKILMQAKYGVTYEKQDLHRAFDDIHASIDELKYYLELLKKQ